MIWEPFKLGVLLNEFIGRLLCNHWYQNAKCRWCQKPEKKKGST